MELSGLGATADGYVAINDSSDRVSRERIFFLDRSCKVTKEVRYSGAGARDPEDLAIGKDGTVWVADIGDNQINAERSNVALWRLPPNSSTTTLFRMSFPQGEAHDAEALVLAADAEFAAIYQKFLDEYAPEGKLFAILPQSVNKIVERVVAASGIGRLDVTPQTLRDTYAVEKARQGLDRGDVDRVAHAGVVGVDDEVLRRGRGFVGRCGYGHECKQRAGGDDLHFGVRRLVAALGLFFMSNEPIRGRNSESGDKSPHSERKNRRTGTYAFNPTITAHISFCHAARTC